MFDLMWGESVCVRKALCDTLPRSFGSTIDKYGLMEFKYPKHEGDPGLVEVTKVIIERQTGLKPKHVFIVNGATGGIVTALRAYFQHGFKYCLTDRPPYFSLYPDMIKNSGLIHLNQDFARAGNAGKVLLIDSPANPTGVVTEVTKSEDSDVEIVWDAVYHNRVYTISNNLPIPSHDIMVGSYSKLLGLNGIRMGWVATDDDELAKTLGQVITAEYVGLSYASTNLLLDVMSNMDWNQFEIEAKEALMRNKAEWKKVIKYFGNQEVPLNGMFYYSYLDNAAKELLEAAGVQYMPGSAMGATDDYGRFNLGQDCAVIEDAVKSILETDK